MWFRSLTHLLAHSPRRRQKRVADSRWQTRRLFLEGLEDRRLLAFNVLAEYPTGNNPQDLALTQIDAGSQLDLIVANGNAGSVGVRLDSAGGAFAAAQNSATGSAPRSIATGDFTGDGITDLVTANGGDVSLLAGIGDGTFQLPQTVGNALPYNLNSVAAGDMNGDGTLDLAVAGSELWEACPDPYCPSFYFGFVDVLLGNGTGGFSASARNYLGGTGYPVAVAIGDINGDTKPDVITANSSPNSLIVLLGDGSGSVGSPIHSGAGEPLRSISLGDVDGDGNVDMLSSNGYSLSVQKGDGLGSFTPLPAVNTGNIVNSAVLGDVNADGKLDLVAVGVSDAYTCTGWDHYGWCYTGFNTFTRTATVLLGNGLGNFLYPLTSVLGSGLGYSQLADIALADLTGDGLPELATVDSRGNSVIVATNNGDWNAPPAIAVSDALAVTEGDDGTINAVFTVTIGGDHTGVSVDYTTVNYAAVGGADFTTVAGTLTFAPGVTSRTISVPILDDALDEYDEQFFLDLSNAVGGQITKSWATGTIIPDNDPVPLMSISDVSTQEGDSDWTSFTFTVSLSAPSGKWVSVSYFNADGTAQISDGDFYSAYESFNFAPGETAAPIVVYVSGDSKPEGDETFFVNLVGAGGASIFDSQGVGTILNDDSEDVPPSISISDASVVEGSSGTRQMTFTVSLSHASSQQVSVIYATANGTAKTSDNDYLASSGRLDFAPGETIKTMIVTIRGDTRKEADERFLVKLSGVVGASITDGQGEGTIFNDDGGGGGKGNGKSSRSNSDTLAVDAAIDDWIASTPKKRRK